MKKKEGMNERKQRKTGDLKINPYATYDHILTRALHTNLKYYFKNQNQLVLQGFTGKEKDLIHLELHSEDDLFFYYESDILPVDLKNFNLKYSLELSNLAEFFLMLEKNLDDFQEGHRSIEFHLSQSSQLVMKILKQINLNQYLVLEIKFTSLKRSKGTELAAFRYGKLREEIHEIEEQIRATKDLIKTRNPYLLTFINKI